MNKNVKRIIAAAVIILLIIACVRIHPKETGEHTDDLILTREQLNQPGRKVGVPTGSANVMIAEHELPQAEIVYMEDSTTGYETVKQGKIDAFIYDRKQMQLAIAGGLSGVRLLDENMDESVRIAVGLSPTTDIPDLKNSMNAFIAEARRDGTLADMYHRWIEIHDETMPWIAPVEEPRYHLRVGTSGTVPPYSYYSGDGLTGHDIELAYRFAAWLGADVEFKVYDYSALISAAVTGDVDCIMANLNVTPERAETIPFSDELYTEDVGIMVRGDPGMTSLKQLASATFGVQTGTTVDADVRARFPDAQIMYFDTLADQLTALRAGKVDAISRDAGILRYMMMENDDIVMLDEKLSDVSMAPAFSRDGKGPQLCEQYNRFIRQLWDDGTMDRISETWFGENESSRTVIDYENLPGPNGTLFMAADATFAPFAYVKDGKIVGYDVDVMARFCEANGYRMEVKNIAFSGVLAAVQSGKADFAACNITVTGERAEQVLFGEPDFRGGNAVAILKKAGGSSGGLRSVWDLNGREVGVQTGTPYDSIVSGALPDARLQYFNFHSDMVAALESGRIDAFPGDEPVMRLLMAENNRIRILDGQLDTFDFGFVFSKTEAGDRIRKQFNEWLAGMKNSGELEKLIRKWTDGPESAKTVPDYKALPATNGTMRFVTDGDYAPMEYYRGSELIGIDVDLAIRFCQASGYGLNVEVIHLDSILPAIQSGKADFAAAGLGITEERKESVNFSDPYYTGGTVFAALKADQASAGQDSFWTGIRTSFNKTFIREERWRLFLEGVITTLVITVLSIMFGTILGFLVFMLCRNGNKAANLITRFVIWLVHGMPVVVLLMVLYYVVFAIDVVIDIGLFDLKLFSIGFREIGAKNVAVVGFTLTFGAAVFSLLKMGVGAVDKGQYEAASALGYSNRRTFFRIILPQALPHVLPAYKGEIVSLIKATAVVGYIAVQDLTKMGDIVRSRTYEAFFPLIAVTVIYFVLEGLIGFTVSRVSVNLNPKRRKPERILKGVKTDD